MITLLPLPLSPLLPLLLPPLLLSPLLFLPLPIPLSLSQGLSALVDTIEECWDEDPEARLSAVNVVLRMKELLDGGPSPLAEDYAPSHTVAPDNDRYRRSDLQESTTDTIGTTDSRPPPYDSRWGYSTAAGRVEDGDGVSDTSSPSGSVGLNVNETTV